MMTTEISTRQADAITELVASLRPDWDKRGIRVACRLAEQINDNPARIAVAAILAATNAANMTPAIIGMRGPHWKSQGDTTPEIPRHGGRCDDCGDFHGPYAPHTPRENERSTRYQDHVAQLRHELAEAKKRLCPHGVPAYACDEHSEHPTEEAV